MIQTFFGIVLLIVMGMFTYMSAHMVDEQKKGKYIPLPWEKGGWKFFDKSDVKYTDGDNT